MHSVAVFGRGALSLTLALLALSGSAGARDLTLLERTAYLMGTRVRVALYERDRQRGMRRSESILRVLEETEAELSTWREDSPLSRLNRWPLGRPLALSRPLCRLLEEVRFWSRRTEGAFDPGVGGLIAAWDLRGQGRRPTLEELERARRAAGIEHLEVDESRAWVVRRTALQLDAGAFGKGEALDRLRRHVPGNWLVDLGGQIAVQELPPGAAAWTVRLAHPLERRRALAEIRLEGGSLATSGGSERDREVGGERIGHILDPRTGEPVPFWGSVVVWHRRALLADVLSTALYVMGPLQGLQWARRQGVAACFLIPRGSRVDWRPTPQFLRHFPGLRLAGGEKR